MAVKHGYKQTEVGVIPDDWEIRSVERFGDVITGGTPSTSESMYWNGEFAWVTPTDISNHRDIFTSERCISIYGMKVIRTLPANTVLVTCIASIGKNAILRVIGACNQQINAIIPNHKHNVEFLYYVFENNKNYLLGNSGITATNIISKESFKRIVFPIPPTLAEQETIAEALNDADTLIEALEQLIAKKRQIRQGAMQELLTGKKRLPGFNGEWDVKEIQSISDVNPESLGSDTRAEYAFKYISLEDVDQGTLKGWTEYIFNTAPSRARRKIKKGDILISTVRPNLQSHCLIQNELDDLVCSTGFSVIRCRPEIAEPDYVLAHFFSSFIEKQIIALVSGSNYPAINSSEVKGLKILVPPTFSEQTAIASILSDMDAEIAAMEEKLVKARQVKQGMMQELLTGRIRLV
jgi:type I restriction enzyme S subunit